MRPCDRERAGVEIVRRIVDRAVAESERASASGARDPIEQTLEETAYLERLRLARRDADGDVASDRSFWRRINARLGSAGVDERRTMLAEVIARFAAEVTGNFNPWVYNLATSVLPVGMGVIFNAASPRLFLQNFPGLPSLTERVMIRGEVDTLRRLHDRGTVILAPTHVSNLDSIVIGWALHSMGLPPFIYGAGLNLFKNPMMSFFMNNLGAYKVDRKKQAPLYKQVLKEYATLTIELGYDNLFFPGGTRSRDGTVEQKLKLGLLGCGLRAYVNNLAANARRPNVYIFPCTLAFPLVLEAENLIEDHLEESGKARFIIEDDEFSQPRRWLSFVQNVLSMSMHITVRIGRPLDPFGNRVDAEGRSLDPKGRVIDPVRYVLVDGKPAELPQRDAEYTRELGASLSAAFARENVVHSTHMLAFCAFRMLARRNPGLDLYRLLRVEEDRAPTGFWAWVRGDDDGEEGGLSLPEVHREMDRLLERIRGLAAADRIQVDGRLDASDGATVADRALRAFGTYHSRPVLKRRGDRIYPQHMQLLYYYHNRLVGYGLERDERDQPIVVTHEAGRGVGAPPGNGGNGGGNGAGSSGRLPAASRAGGPAASPATSPTSDPGEARP